MKLEHRKLIKDTMDFSIELEEAYIGIIEGCFFGEDRKMAVNWAKDCLDCYEMNCYVPSLHALQQYVKRNNEEKAAREAAKNNESV